MKYTMELMINLHIEKLPEGVYLATCEDLPGLVVLQPDKLGFSWSVSVQGKARLAVNGPVAVYKSRNAAMDADRPTLRALLWRSAAAFPCLERGTAIPCARRLAAKRHRNAES